jgi:hypothetical protein
VRGSPPRRALTPAPATGRRDGRTVGVADPGGLDGQLRRLGLGVPGSDRLVGLVERRVVGVDHDAGEDAGDGPGQGRVEPAPEQGPDGGLRLGDEQD